MAEAIYCLNYESLRKRDLYTSGVAVIFLETKTGAAELGEIVIKCLLQ